MAYHLTGAISSVIFLLTIGGIWSQLRFIFERKKSAATGILTQAPTAVLSLNQFVSSFLAFFSFFLYGACLTRFNHYLVWTRLAACLLTAAVLFEIFRDRRDGLSAISFASCVVLLVATPAALLWNPSGVGSGKIISQVLIVIVTAILAQGYLHQVWLIRRTGQTGAVALRMHQFFLLKDIATIAFALTMGVVAGWPLLLLSSVSGITKVITIWHFRWVKVSPVAKARREKTHQTPPSEVLAMG